MIKQLTESLPLFVAGAIGAALAALIGLPMPFMLGALAGSATAVAMIERQPQRRAGRPPAKLRIIFVAMIGVMIGAGFHPGLLAVLPAFWPSVLAVVPFIMLAHVGGYLIMHHLGGFRPVDALFASMPGGLIESSILGEKAGADVQVLAIQHFIRIILVVTLVPLLFWLFTGELVGSAAGASLARGGYDIWDVGLIVLLAPVGNWLGKTGRLPAAHLMGPLFFTAALQVSGLIDLTAPTWLLRVAQLVVGVGLGAQFSGLSRAALLRGLASGIGAVSFMLLLSFAFAAVLSRVVPGQIEAMFLSFAPGGVTEMNLIALSLNLSPVIVAVHHLVRILASIVVANAIGRWKSLY